jgi:response regulator RpfG family c-di-GMP phosphodiesterase
MNKEGEITILYVDDEDINLFIFNKSFSHKYTVLTASSGNEGLDLLSAHQDKIIVVISDMRMPGMNGVEFITKAKKLHNKIEYFILTGFEFNDDIKTAIENKIVQKFFTKPFDYEEISLTIDNVVERLKD